MIQASIEREAILRVTSQLGVIKIISSAVLSETICTARVYILLFCLIGLIVYGADL